jgi:hypothetical protein
MNMAWAALLTISLRRAETVTNSLSLSIVTP